MALGARRGNVVRLVPESSLLTVAAGAAAGLALSLVLGKLLASATTGTVRDPLMLVLVSAVLSIVAMLSTLFPAWRAALIDPLQAIRAE